MANIKDYIKKVMDGTVSLEEQQAALAQVEKTIVEAKQKRDEAVGQKADMVVQALKKIESKLEAKLDELNNTPAMKGEPGPRGKDGRDGKDGLNGRDGISGKDGVDGKDGLDGQDGVSVVDAKIDFDGGLVIYLSNGNEIDCGQILPPETAQNIIINSGGSGTSQAVTDTLVDLQNQINILTGIDGTLGTMAQQDETAVDINGGAIDNTPIGATTPSTGAFTDLSSNGNTSFSNGSAQLTLQDGGSTKYNNLLIGGISGLGRVRWYTPTQLRITTNQNDIHLRTGASSVLGGEGNSQLQIAHTASAVNFVQVTGSATNPGASALGGILFTGSDAGVNAAITTKGTGYIAFAGGSSTSTQAFRIATTNAAATGTLLQVQGAAAGSAPSLSAISGASNADTNIDLALTPKGTGAVNAGTQNANFLRLAGNSANNSPELSVAGTDANIPLTFESKGTGAINLASGSRGVNISNGGTVTAITRTAQGSGYTTPPGVAISAPTTAGGVQATATANLSNAAATATITSGGTGYTVNDVLTFVGGTFTQASQVRVTAVSAGVITTISTISGGIYSIVPTNPISVTGGTGTGATFTLSNWALSATFTITNAGSGYVEQPTVTFSGGGGSGATAYASVGATTTFRTIGHTGTVAMRFDVPSSLPNNIPTLRLIDSSNAQDSGVQVLGGIGGSVMNAFGAANATLALHAAGTGFVRLGSGGTSQTEQLRVTHTASAVNYVQVTGAATTGYPVISAQGSDASTGLIFQAKGTAFFRFSTGGSPNADQVRITHTANPVNYLGFTGAVAGGSPTISVAGTDTNIDLALTPKGTGNVRFGTYTATVSTITGYIEIKDAGGTVRRLAVVG